MTLLKNNPTKKYEYDYKSKRLKEIVDVDDFSNRKLSLSIAGSANSKLLGSYTTDDKQYFIVVKVWDDEHVKNGVYHVRAKQYTDDPNEKRYIYVEI